MRIRAVWSEAIFGKFSIAFDPLFVHADNEDSNRIVRMHRLIWVVFVNTSQKVLFLALRLKWEMRQRDEQFIYTQLRFIILHISQAYYNHMYSKRVYGFFGSYIKHTSNNSDIIIRTL